MVLAAWSARRSANHHDTVPRLILLIPITDRATVSISRSDACGIPNQHSARAVTSTREPPLLNATSALQLIAGRSPAAQDQGQRSPLFLTHIGETLGQGRTKFDLFAQLKPWIRRRYRAARRFTQASEWTGPFASCPLAEGSFIGVLAAGFGRQGNTRHPAFIIGERAHMCGVQGPARARSND